MPGPESEIGILKQPVVIDAPPGTLPPPDNKQKAKQIPIPLASKLEAVSTNEDTPSDSTRSTFPELLNIISDVKAPFTPSKKLASELKHIFSSPIRSVTVPHYPGKGTYPPRFKSRETEIMEHSLEGDLQSIPTYTERGNLYVYRGVTVQGKEWHIGTPFERFKVSKQEIPYRLNGAGGELEKRQETFLHGGKANLRHDKFLSFLQ